MSTSNLSVYRPDEMECEKASNSYLMSLIAIIAGMPFPIINLIATFIFFLGNRKGTHFVRWHCIQALLAQMTLVLINSVAFGWTITIVTGHGSFSNAYFGYLVTILLFNLAEFCGTVFSAVTVRKGNHPYWWIYGPLTDLICKR